MDRNLRTHEWLGHASFGGDRTSGCLDSPPSQMPVSIQYAVHDWFKIGIGLSSLDYQLKVSEPGGESRECAFFLAL